MRWTVIILAALLLPGPVFATNANQDDGGSGTDATCDPYGPILEVGENASGLLDPPRDREDCYGLNVTSRHVGNEVTVDLTSSSGTELQLDVYNPDGEHVIAGQHPSCEHAECAPGHNGSEGDGHTCSEHGHTIECGGENGTRNEDGSITFTPEQEGVYIIEVTVDPQDEPHGPPSNRGPDPKGPSLQSCHDACENFLSYDLSSDSDSTLQ